MTENKTIADLVRQSMRNAQLANRIADIVENLSDNLMDILCPLCGPRGPLDGRMIRMDLRALGAGPDVLLVCGQCWWHERERD